MLSFYQRQRSHCSFMESDELMDIVVEYQTQRKVGTITCED